MLKIGWTWTHESRNLTRYLAGCTTMECQFRNLETVGDFLSMKSAPLIRDFLSPFYLSPLSIEEEQETVKTHAPILFPIHLIRLPHRHFHLQHFSPICKIIYLSILCDSQETAIPLETTVVAQAFVDMLKIIEKMSDFGYTIVLCVCVRESCWIHELVSELKIGAVNHTCECLLARDVRITRRSGIVVGGVASSAKIDSGE
ncbi:hypothetical protein LXL04_037728 [Taraxacum kok-saghyz]